MKLDKGFYLIGLDVENSKTYNFGDEIRRFDTLEKALIGKNLKNEENFPYVDVDIKILEVEENE